MGISDEAPIDKSRKFFFKGRLCGHCCPPPAMEKCLLCAVCNFLMTWWGCANTWHGHLQTGDVFLLGACFILCPSGPWSRKEIVPWWYTARWTSHAVSTKYTMSINQIFIFRVVDPLFCLKMLLLGVLAKFEYISSIEYHILLYVVFLCVCYSNGTPALWTW